VPLDVVEFYLKQHPIWKRKPMVANPVNNSKKRDQKTASKGTTKQSKGTTLKVVNQRRAINDSEDEEKSNQNEGN
jgi:hypothetical protein